MDKPDGLYVILPEQAEGFIKKMPIKQFFGIGKATAEKMKLAGIFTGNDLRKKSLADLTLRYGKTGTYYYHICRGIDNRTVKPDRERKSLSAENTFNEDLKEESDIRSELARIAKETFRRYSKSDKRGKTVSIKLKYGDFRQITRSQTNDHKITSESQLVDIVQSVFDPTLMDETGFRLLGVGISNFEEEEKPTVTQLTLKF